VIPIVALRVRSTVGAGGSIRAAVASAAVLLAGCAPTTPPKMPDVSRDQVAAVLVSATMVAPWQQVADAMAPNFTLGNGDAALQQVAPITDRTTEQILRAFGLTAGVGLPQSSRNSSSTTTSGSASNAANTLAAIQNTAEATGSNQSSSETSSTLPNGTTTNSGSTASGATSSSNTNSTTSANTTNGATTTTNTTTTVTTSTAPGVAPAAPTGTPAGGQLPSAPANTGGTDIDPVLKYQAAQALFQAVQLMNREVQFAAANGDYAPYLVQIKLAVIPYKRRIPYDVHARISFFLGCGKGPVSGPNLNPVKLLEPPPGVRLIRTSLASTSPVAQAAPAVPPAQAAPAPQGAPTARIPNADTSKNLCNQAPVIVPLLVTDDVERAIRSRAEGTARQIAVALSMLTGGIAGNAGINRLTQTLNTQLGQELNSHLMVSRLADNTMYARVGGTADPTSGTNLVGQNYNISVLLLVPKEYVSPASTGAKPLGRDVQVVASTELRYSATGEILRTRDVTKYDQQIKDAIDETFPEPNAQGPLHDDSPRGTWNRVTARPDAIRPLRSAIERGDLEEFLKAARAAFGEKATEGELKSLWARLTGLIADSSFKSAALTLPDPPADNLPKTKGAAMVFDDGRSSAIVVLQNVGWLSSSTLGAVLNVRAVKDGSALDFPFPAQSIVLDQRRETLTLTFPSPAKWGIQTIDQKQSALHVYLGSCTNDCDRSFAVSLVKSEAAAEEKAAFTFTSQVSSIVPAAGVGSIDVALEKLDKTKYDTIKITWTGGMFASAQFGGKSVTPESGAISLTDNGTLHLTFSNLVPSTPLILMAEGVKEKKSVAKSPPLLFTIAP
jgi:hypothetical protein